MGTGVGEAMLIGAAVGAGTGAAGSAISGGDPMKGALTGAATGAITGGIGNYMNPAVQGAVGADAVASQLGVQGAATGANSQAGMLAAQNAGFGLEGLQSISGAAGQAIPTTAVAPGTAGITAGMPVTQTPISQSMLTPGPAPAGYKPNIFGYQPGESGYLTNAQLGMIGGTSALGAAMGAERAMYGMPSGQGEYDGPLSKLKYDPNKFTASEPTYAPDSVYRPQYRTYAAEGGIMRLARGGNIDDTSGVDEPAYMAAGGTPAELAPAGLERLMGVKGKGQSLQEMRESAALQGLTPAAYASIYGEGIKAQQQMARGGISSLGGYSDGGRMLKGPGDGMSDSIPGVIGGKQPARLADGEFVVPADVVSHLGNGSTDAGAKQLYSMMDKVRKARTGKKAQGKQINPRKYMPA